MSTGDSRGAAIRAALLERVTDALGLDESNFQPGVALADLGLESLQAMALIEELESRHGIKLPVELLTPQVTFDAFADAVVLGLHGRASSNGGHAVLPVVPSEHRAVPCRLSPLQQAYLVGRSESMPLGGHGCVSYFEFEGDAIDPGRLQAAWRRVIEHYEALRTVVTGSAEQRTLEAVDVPEIAVSDLRELDAAEIRRSLDATRERMSAQGYDPADWPLFTLHVSRLPGDRCRTHIAIDLLFIDAAGLHTVFETWGRVYRDPHVALAPPPMTMREYRSSESAASSESGEAEARDYWWARAEQMPAGPALQYRVPLTEIRNCAYVRRTFELAASQWHDLSALATRNNVSTGTLMLSVVADVLRTWSASPRFTLNVPTFFRRPLHPRIDELVGNFGSTMLLEADGGGATFAARASGMQRRLLEDLRHRNVGGIDVLRMVQKRQHVDPFVFAPVVVTNVLGHRLAQQEGLASRWLGELVFGLNRTPQVAMDCQLANSEGDGVAVSWDVAVDAFAPAILDAVVRSHCDTLHKLAADPACWTSRRIVALSPDRWSRQDRAAEPVWARRDERLESGFFERALLRPQDRALISRDWSTTYGELARRAECIAAGLAAAGIRKEALFAVAMGVGEDLVATLLGVLRSGAAYVPFDPTGPAQRRDAMLGMLSCDGIVTTSAHAAAFADAPSRVLVLGELEQSSATPVADADRTRNDLAYVMFTSGTTGVPKGIMIEHAAALNTIHDVVDRFQLTAGDRFFALSAPTFDLSVFDVFGALGIGATLVLPDPARGYDPAHMYEMVSSGEVSVWNSVPALMGLLLDYGRGVPAFSLETLRTIMLSGDWIAPSLAARVKALAPHAALYSLGGATEASIWSIYHPIREIAADATSIPYGRPLAHQRVDVVHDDLSPCPDGVEGEIVIGGRGLARGYVDAKATEASFVVDPEIAERWYRTGDRGRYLPSGDIEILGRRDFQVKINGFRIELGEIEAAIRAHPAVQDVVVDAVGDRFTAQQLTAYIRLHAKAPEDVWLEANASESAPLHADAPENGRPHAKQPENALPHAEASENGHSTRTRTDSSLALPREDLGEPALRRKYQRRSCVEFLPDRLDVADVGRLLEALRPVTVEGRHKYLYPSAGALYPVRCYVVVGGEVRGLATGAYAYDPLDHALVRVGDGFEPHELYLGENVRRAQGAKCVLVLAGSVDKVAATYGPLARDFCLLEAGYIGQLLMTVATEQSMGLCPMGLIRSDRLAGRLDLPATDEILHSFIVGLPADRELAEAPAHAVVSAGAGAGANNGGVALNSVVTSTDIRAFIGERLPRYMLPTSYVFVDGFPLNANGKIDRTALRARAETRGMPDAVAATDFTATEKTLCDIASAVFAIEAVDIDAAFFDLGANSVQLAQLSTVVESRIGRTISVVDAFRYPTIRKLAAFIDSSEPDVSGATAERARARSVLRREHRRSADGEDAHA